MKPLGMFSNNILVAALSAWWLSQSAKVPLHYLKTRQWDWSLLLPLQSGRYAERSFRDGGSRGPCGRPVHRLQHRHICHGLRSGQ